MPVRDDIEERRMLLSHFKRLREMPQLATSRLIFIPENNLGLESAHLYTMVGDVPRVETYFDKDKPGVHKDDKATRGYHFFLVNALAEGTIHFDQDLFTTSNEQTPQSMLEMLQDQMHRFHWEKKKAVDVFGKDRYALTGKVGNKQDDLLICMTMVPYWGQQVVQFSDRIRT